MIDFQKKVDELNALISKELFSSECTLGKYPGAKDWHLEEGLISPLRIRSFIEAWFLLCQTEKEIETSHRLVCIAIKDNFKNRHNIKILSEIALKLKKEIDPKPKSKKRSKTKPTYLQYALYYWYLQQARIKEWFENWDGGIENAYKEVCRVEGLTAKTSWQKFRNEYRKICQEHTRKLVASRNHTKLIKLLEKYPKAIDEVHKETKRNT